MKEIQLDCLTYNCKNNNHGICILSWIHITNKKCDMYEDKEILKSHD